MHKWLGTGWVVVRVTILAVLLLVCSCWTPSSPTGSQDAGATETRSSGADLLEGPPPGGCLPQDCGLNGAWFGDELAFRTLYIPPPRGPQPPFDQALTITSFSKGNENLELDVAADELVGIRGNHVKISGEDLIGATIVIAGPSGKYFLTIYGVEHPDFWTKCIRASNECRAATTAYRFIVIKSSGERVQLCKPGLADDSPFRGTVVMFRGDSYDGRSLEVQASYDSSFNFACYGTTISKLHFLRHTSAAMGVAAFPVAQRQAILRMLAGDYCGNGYQFTLQGHPIRIGFDKAAPRPVTEVGLGSAKSLDAMWKKDGTGASCIGAPRLSDEPGPVSSDSIDTLVTKIQDYCKEKERPIPPQCEASRWERAKLGDMGTDYLVSANLFSVPAP